jgi:DNA polymerase-3 subunit delta'
MLFKDVIGQKKVIQHLIETQQQGRTAHAQLFVGPEGAGGLPLALAYAQYLQCENPQPEDACGRCSACVKMQKLMHIDYHFAFPVIGTGKISNDYLKEWREFLLENPYGTMVQWLQKMKAENQQGNLSKAECVEIMRKLSYTKSEGKYKIMILWLPEYLGKEGNRLLKLIEEPEPDTVFLFVAEQPEKILNTILSRCQPVKIPPIEAQDIERGLQARGCGQQQALRIAQWAEGSWSRALQLLDSPQTDLSQAWLQWMQACQRPTGYPAALSQWLDRVLNEWKWGRKDQLQWIQYGLFFLREMLTLRILGQQDSPRLSAEELVEAKKWKLGVQGYDELIRLLDEYAYFIERNGNPKILFLDLGIKFGRVLRERRGG